MRKNSARRARAYHAIDVLALVFLGIASVVMMVLVVAGVWMAAVAGAGEEEFWLLVAAVLGLPVMLVDFARFLGLMLSGVLFNRLGVAPCPKCGRNNLSGDYIKLVCSECGFSTEFHDRKGSYTWWELSAGDSGRAGIRMGVSRR